MSNQYLSFDVTKQSAPQQLITGRQGDSQLKFVTMLFWDGDQNVPYDLTGKQVAFEALKPDNTHIVDYEGITILDAPAGIVRYSFNEQVFSVAGTMQQAFFKITHTDSDNNVIADSTLEVAINILENRVEFGINSKDYLSEYDDLVDQVKKKFDDYAATVQDSITKAQTLHDEIVEYTNLINSNGVITKNDFGDISKIKQPIGTNFVDKLNNEFSDRGVNVKWLGAKGDGVTDDSDVFQSAIKLGLPIFVPAGTYKFSKAVNVDLTTNSAIFGNMPMANWNNSNKKTVILAEDDYAFVFDDAGGGKSCIDFKNICFQGLGLKNITSSQIIDCEFSGDTGIKNGKGLIIDKSSFHSCTTAGILQLTDSRVSSSTFYSNGVGLQLDASNDNIIMDNRIEWNNLGISIQGNYNLVFGNNIDRNTTYGVYVNQLSFSKFFGNHMERNLTNNVYFYYGNQVSFSNNTIVSKHNDDTSDSLPLPNIAIKVHYLEGSSITNNNVTVPSGGKMMEKDGDTPNVNLKLEGNVLNGVDLENLVANFTTPLTTSEYVTATYTLDLGNLASKYGFDSSSFKSDYLKITAYSVDSSDSNHYSFNKDTSCGIGSDGKPFINIYSSSSTPVTINGASLEFKINYLGLLSLKVA